MAHAMVQHPVTRAFVTPSHATSYSQSGVHTNTHHASLELAEAAFETLVEETEANYRDGKTRNYTIKRLAAGDPGTEHWAPYLLRQVVLRNVKKNGKPGAFCSTIQLFELM